MKLFKFKRMLSLVLAAMLLLPIIGTVSASASTSSACTIASLSDYETAAKALTIYSTEHVKGTNHSNGANVGNYKFDENEKALSIIKSTSNYMGSLYRFHLKLASGVKLPTAQSWMVVSYKTNATANAKFTMVSNDGKARVTMASDISVSNGEYVYSTPVDISGALMDRLNIGNHNAVIIGLPETTSDSVYFYINTIAFFESEAAAKAYTEKGITPSESTTPGTDGNTDTGEIKGTSSFVGGSYTHNGLTIATSLYVPESYTPDKEYALLIYLHNDGNRGDTPSFTSGTGNALTKNIIEKYGDEFIIFAPRVPSDKSYQWVQSSWTPGTYSYADTPISKPMDATINYIYKEIIAKYNIDDTRIYAAGDSMGGGGTWDLMLREPDLLAAAVTVSAYCDPSQAANIRDDLKIWIFHTAQDNVVNVCGDRAMYAALKNFGRDVRYTEYDVEKPEDEALFESAKRSSPNNWRHWAWTPAYSNMEMIEWLVSQRKGTTEKLTNKFTDIDETNPYYKAILSLADSKYINGTGDGTTYSPDMTMTRAMFVTVLGRIAGVDIAKYQNVTFTDVVAGQWHAPYVEWAAANGIVNGYPDGRYGINDEIKIQEALVILQRFSEKKTAAVNTQYTLTNFSDRYDVASWASDGIEWAISNGIYLGTTTKYSTKMLYPTKSASRGLVASILYNYTEIFG